MVFKIGNKSWNKGLTKETDERVKEISKNIGKTRKEKIFNGEIVLPWKGKKRSKEFINNMVKVRKGKTYEELYGKEKAKELKESLSKKLKGNKNCLGTISTKKNKKYIEFYGDERTIEIKNKMNKIKIGKFLGEKHPNWKGGISLLNRRLRNSSVYKIWRELVFLKDNFTCQNPNCEYCNNKIGVFLHPHHIKSFANYPELRFVVSNGITYCKEYHINSKELHKCILKEVN